jgi:glucokinase
MGRKMFNIGVDLGGTNIAAAIVAADGKIIRKDSIPTNREREYGLIIEDMTNLCKKMIENENLDEKELHSIGIGSPGTVDPIKGEVVYANNLDFKNVPLVKEFQKHFDKPIYIGNDANLAAYGEYQSGAGEKYNSLVAITLGTGVGSGIIIDGKILEGSFFAGAELGHTVMAIDGRPCTCGRKGCWETYSSATALISEAKKAALGNQDSLLNTLVQKDLTKMNAKIPFDAAQAGDVVAQLVIGDYIKYLAIGLVNVINTIQPEVIVLGGGVSAQKEKLIIPLKARMTEEIYGGAEAFKTAIKVAELGNDAGIIGAAMLYKNFEI